MENEERRKEFTTSRTYNAGIAKVWEAFTDQRIVASWWGPAGVTVPVCEIDPRPGGRIKIVMVGGKEMGPAEGQEWPMTGTFEEVVEYERLIYSSESLQDKDGRRIMVETETTITFKEDNGKTNVTVNVSFVRISDSPEGQYAVQGVQWAWTQQMEKIEKVLN